MKTLMIDIADEYRQARLRIARYTCDLGADELASPVPACPGWSVKDVIAHLSGAAADLVSGNMADAPKPEWTAAHVAAGAGASVTQLLDRWDGVARDLEPAMASSPEDYTFFIADILCHEIDIRSAVGGDVHVAPPAAIKWLAGNFVRLMGRKVTAAGVPALRIVAGDEEWVAGESAGGALLEAPSAFELARAMTGRRSLDQIRAWAWGGDPEIYLPYVSVFQPRPQTLEEG